MVNTGGTAHALKFRSEDFAEGQIWQTDRVDACAVSFIERGNVRNVDRIFFSFALLGELLRAR